MTTRTLCEATAMDVARFGSWDDAVPPCGEPAAVDVDGYLLCHGCARALEDLGRLGRAGFRERMVQAARAELGRDLLFVIGVVLALSIAAGVLLAVLEGR